MLCLLQLADHTKVDLGQAAAEQLERYTRKCPPVRTIEVPPAGAPRPVEIHVLVDYENVQPTDAELRDLVPGVSDVWVFHRPHQKRVDSHFTSLGKNVTAVPISKTGKNSLDFHLSYCMGYITSRNPNARFVVVANDKGYEPLLVHAKELGFAVEKRGHGRTAATTKAGKHAVVKKAAAAGVSAKIPAAVGVPGSPAALTKIVYSLKKMGNKRPAKLASLRRTVKMLLGAAAADDAVNSLVSSLMARNAVAIGPRGEMVYRV